MNRRRLFGPVWLEKGIAFRLFAPDAQSVELMHDEGEPEEMQKLEDGWFELTREGAGSGGQYQFRIDAEHVIPDPASHFQPDDVHGKSEVIDPTGFTWTDHEWVGRPWEEVVIYELHTGCFSASGNYKGIEEKLDYLVELGVTAIELMPLADFVGKRGWGYDGVLPYAPESAYGRPHELKHLIDSAHAKGLMVFLDVVYNHFGPDGNYLNQYAKGFFNEQRQTPWGAAIHFERRQVRDFFIGNALYWLHDYHFDGLRFDAVHAIADESETPILTELTQAVRATFPERHIHLMLENDKNEAHYLQESPARYDAQWNDDIHHVFHVLLTGETSGYYEDYKDETLQKLGRCLSEGFAYQGDPSQHRGGELRGEKSKGLSPASFIAFLQNHDQIGNRAMGERIDQLASEDTLRLATVILSLSPQIPMLFMGQEWGAKTPFYYFCDFDGELAGAVREGRRKEFARFPGFADETARSHIPDPNDESSFLASRLKWQEAEQEKCKAKLAVVKQLLNIRHEHIVPLLASGFIASSYECEGSLLKVNWLFKTGELTMIANFSGDAASNQKPEGKVIWPDSGETLAAWSCAWIVRAHG